MKRDMKLIRQMLVITEDASGSPDFHSLETEEVSFDCIRHHCLLLKEAGLAAGPPSKEDSSLEGTVFAGGWVENSQVTRLTWSGHDFLAAAKDEDRWNKAMATVKQLGGAVTFAGFKVILTVLMEQAIKTAIGGPAASAS